MDVRLQIPRRAPDTGPVVRVSENGSRLAVRENRKTARRALLAHEIGGGEREGIGTADCEGPDGEEAFDFHASAGGNDFNAIDLRVLDVRREGDVQLTVGN